MTLMWGVAHLPQPLLIAHDELGQPRHLDLDPHVLVVRVHLDDLHCREDYFL